MAESVGLPFGAYVVVTDVVSPDAGLLAGTAVVWLLIAIRKLVSGSVSSLLMISALVLTIQTAVAISTGYMWMFQLQFPLANLAMSVVFARTAPTGKPLVAQLAEEVVALKQPETHHPGLHRFFQGVTWFWAGLFLLLTLGMSFMMDDRAVQALHGAVVGGHHRPDARRRRHLRRVVPRGRPPPRPAPPLLGRLSVTCRAAG